jgi:3'-phosphoadenosine 5'-phosphosulfate sulfotransferase (PAPS reductase)/FAD synthetase
MKATLKFPTREQAEKFAIDWGRYSSTGHIVGAGQKDVDVTIFDVKEKDKVWIDGYVGGINQSIIESGENLSDKMNYNSPLTVLSFGGGQDSTAILYKLVEDPEWKRKYVSGKLICIMANTGNEHPETYSHVDEIWNYCADNGIEFYLLGFEYTPASYKEGLVYHYERHNNIGSKAYPKTCTANLKLVPIYNFLNDYIHINFQTEQHTRKRAIKELTEVNGKINMIIGIALGEESRVSEDVSDWNSWQGRISRVYPLLEEKMDRGACQHYIASIGKKVPIPSACIICPFMNDQELLYIYRFQREWYDKWVELEQTKIDAKGLPEDKTKAMDSNGKIVANLGVWGKKLLPEKLEEVLEKHGHMTDDEVWKYRFSHGHCVKNKM